MLNSNTESLNKPVKQSAAIAAVMADAWKLRARNRIEQADKACRAVLAMNPVCGEAMHLLALLAHDQGHHSRAVEQFKAAINVEPHQPLHHSNLGVVLLSMGRYEEAESCFSDALDISPDYHDAKSNLGLAWYHQNHFSSAARCFEEILGYKPKHDAALANLGMTRLAQHRHAEAAVAYEKAVSLNPSQPKWHGNLGAAYMRLERYAQSAACYLEAAQIDPGNPDYMVSRAIALRAAGQLTESIQVLEQVSSKYPDLSAAVAQLVVGLEYTCQWDKLELYHPMLEQATQRALAEGRVPDEDPMLNIRRSSDAALNQAVSRAWSRDLQRKALRIARPLTHPQRQRRNGRITIGYISYDFRNHPVAHQLYPLFRMHDRERFRILAFSIGPDDGSAYRREIMAGCDEFIDLRTHGLAAATQAIYDRQVDILVDLMGHSHHHRLEILALRPAPVQVGYLGFLSTSGAQFIDYLVADSVVVPRDHHPYYDEKLLRMPHCYQFNHTGLKTDRNDAERAAWGLPPSAFVYCCFNAVYKIDRQLFESWMRILYQTANAVLWLNGANPMAFEQMRQRAQLAGIDPQRLIFAPKVPLDDHLHRLALADLALDTLRYNGGATTANALAAGVPVITVLGNHWVSRMSSSHLMAVGLPELVFENRRTYETAAVDLAGHPHKVDTLHRRLAQQNDAVMLFNPELFTRHLEFGFESIWQRYVDGLAPDHIDIPNLYASSNHA